MSSVGVRCIARYLTSPGTAASRQGTAAVTGNLFVPSDVTCHGSTGLSPRA